MAKSTRRQTPATQKSTARNSRATVSGPAAPDGSGEGDVLADKMAGTQDLTSAFPFNPIKREEYDPAAALAPSEGPSAKPADPIVGASTVSESNGSEKTGSGGPNLGHNPTVGPLDRVRVDSTGRAITTDTARDVRGFAVKFYTDEGNWDLVGNNHPGVLHPGCDEVPRPRARGQAGTALRDAGGRVGARYVLGLCLADAGDHPHADVGDVRSSQRPSRRAWASASALRRCPTTEPDPGLIIAAIDSSDAGDRFVAAIAKHRHFVRETDPPRV